MSALERYKECEGDTIETPLERLRFFCSGAMHGEDWLDSEPFFEAVEQRIAELEKERKPVAWLATDLDGRGDVVGWIGPLQRKMT